MLMQADRLRQTLSARLSTLPSTPADFPGCERVLTPRPSPWNIPWQAEDELPERLIGSVRFEHLDLKTAAYLDDETGKIYKNDKML